MVGLSLALLAGRFALEAQQPTRVFRIGFLGTGAPNETAARLRAVKALGLTIPPAVLTRADEVIR
jgi:hypothetical protein